MAATFIASRPATRRQGIILVAGKNYSGAILSGSVVTMTISGLLTLDPA